MSNLFDMLPDFYFTSEEVKAIQGGIEVEIKGLQAAQEDLLNQLFVDTATWGLKYWERYVGLQVDISKPYDFRRSRIKSRLRGKGTTTIQMIKNVAESFSNGEVDIIEDYANYSFIIKFVGTRGIPPNMNDLKNTIEEIKPAHLGFVYEFTYTVWNEVKALTWGQIKTGTWEDLKTRKVI